MNSAKSRAKIASQGIPTLIPLTVITGNSKNKRDHFIGLGELGSKALLYCKKQENDAAFTVITDRWNEQDNPGINYVELKRPPLIHSDPVNTDLLRYWDVFGNQSMLTGDIKQAFAKEYRYIVFVGLENYVRDDLSQQLIEWLTANKKDFFFFCIATTQPFGFYLGDLSKETIEKKIERLNLGKFIDYKSRFPKPDEKTMDELFEKLS